MGLELAILVTPGAEARHEEIVIVPVFADGVRGSPVTITLTAASRPITERAYLEIEAYQEGADIGSGMIEVPIEPKED